MSRRFLTPPAMRPVERQAPPTFAIAIPAYQSAATIGAAIESALAQTLPPVQIGVCDDGSTDDLDSALAPYRDRIVLVRQENRGCAAAKNAAARATTADFVAFLDADDVYHPERLEAMAELASARPDLDVITTNAELEVDGEIRGLYYPAIATFPVENQAVGIIASDSAILGAAAVRRSTFDAAGGMDDEIRLSEDWEFWIRIALRGARFGCVDEPLYRYVVHENGLSADMVRGWRSTADFLERLLHTVEATPAEKRALGLKLAHNRRAAELIEAEAAIRNRDTDARARSRAIAANPEHGVPTRLKAAFAMTAPLLACLLLELRERKTGRSRLRKAIPDP